MADEGATSHLIKKILNVIAFLLFFSSSLLSALGPGHYYGHKETYITPAAYSFWVWTLIDILLLGLVIYQFFPGGSELVVDLIGWRFIIIGVLNAIFVHLYITSHYIPAFIFALLTALAISHVYYDLKTKSTPSSSLDVLFVHLPFSLWHAYAVVTVVLSLFSAFGRSTDHSAGIGTKVFVVLALAWLSATSIGYALHSEKGDIAGAVVIAWELFAIFLNQHEVLIHWVALAAFIISILSIVKVLYFTFSTRGSIALPADDSERAPLVG